MNFQYALNAMKAGRYLARQTWGSRVYIYLDGDIITYSHNGFDSPWQPGHPDLFAEDWQEVIPQP